MQRAEVDEHLDLAARRVPAHVGRVERLRRRDAVEAHLVHCGIVGDFTRRKRAVVEANRVDAPFVVALVFRPAADGGVREAGDPSKIGSLKLLVADTGGARDSTLVEQHRRIAPATTRAIHDGEVVGRAGGIQAGQDVAGFIVCLVEPQLVYRAVPKHAEQGVAGGKHHAAPRLGVAVLHVNREVLARLARRRAGIAMRLEESFAPVRVAVKREVEATLEVLPCLRRRIECTCPDIVYGVPVVHEPVLDVGGRGHRGSRRGVDRKLVGDDAPVRADAGHDRLARPDGVIVLVDDGVVDVLHE